MPNKIIFLSLCLLLFPTFSFAEELPAAEVEAGTKTETEVIIKNEVNPTDDQKTIIARVKDILEDITDTIDDTAENIDSVNFEDSIFTEYLGYARYVLGDMFYLLFSSVCLISLGIGLFTSFLRGWQLIRSLLP